MSVRFTDRYIIVKGLNPTVGIKENEHLFCKDGKEERHGTENVFVVSATPNNGNLVE